MVFDRISLQKWPCSNTLKTLKRFSHYLQSDQESVTSANIHIDTPKAFISFKDGSGQLLYNFVICFNETGKFQNRVSEYICCQTAGDENKFTQTKKQFTRGCMIIFFSEDLLKCSLVLNKINSPNDPIEFALYGDREVSLLFKGLRIYSFSTCNILTDKQPLKVAREIITL